MFKIFKLYRELQSLKDQNRTLRERLYQADKECAMRILALRQDTADRMADHFAELMKLKLNK